MRRAASFIFAIGALASIALAHPMGNFSVSHNTSFDIERRWMRIALRIDIAEIPTVEEMKQLDANHDGKIAPAEKEAYLQSRVLGSVKMQSLKLDGKDVEPQILRMDVIQSEGSGGLPTLLLVADYRVAFDASAAQHILEYADHSFDGRAGWREITARAGPGMRIVESNVPEKDISRGLTVYPETLVGNPPQVSSARIVFAPRTGPTTGEASTEVRAAAPPKRQQDALAEILTGKRSSRWLILLSLPVAVALGAFHGLSPGHGKTVVAAYLVGSRGTAWHAFFLGLVVTLTHTAGVFALGFIVLFASGRVIPEQMYPWLGFISGAMIFAVGSWQFVRRVSANYSTTQIQDPHGPGGHAHTMPDGISATSLIALGISGGIVPCPSALIVMLSAIALRRTAEGILLIVAFSLGLASILILIGMAAVLSQRWLSRWSWEASLTGKLRLMSSLAVTLLGIGIAFQSLRGGGIL